MAYESPAFAISSTDGSSTSMLESLSSVDSFGSFVKSKYFDHEDGRRSYYPEFYSHGAKIERGGFSLKSNETSGMKYKMRGYPPPPSSVCAMFYKSEE